MDSLVSTCPVPLEQQPINEYTGLRDSWFFRWATLGLRAYITPMVWIWGLSWVITGPIAATSFPPAKYPGQFFLSGALGASILLALPLIRLYSGWLYVQERLTAETIFYEESGWYDGQTWSKPVEVVTRDRLIVAHQIQPILNRLRRTFSLMAGSLLVGSLVWFLL